MQLYLAVTPGEVRDASPYTKVFAHVAYRIGPESTLLRRDMLLEARGGLLSLSDQDAPAVQQPEKLAAAIVRECGRRNFRGAVLDFERDPTLDRKALVLALSPMLSRSRMELFVPERYAAPGAVVLINTALSGGNYRVRLQEALSRHGRVALDAQRLAMDFSLPSPSGEGQPLRRQQLTQLMEEFSPSVFFSQDLCARYFTYTKRGETHFVLYDDGDTMLQKLRIGGSMGYRAGLLMYPEVSDLLPKLFGTPGKA